MFKFVLIAVLFCLCCSVGYVFSIKYLKRKRFFSSLISLADKLSLEINFSRERLKVLLANFDETSKKHLLGVDENFERYLDKNCELTKEEIFKKADCLKDEEKDQVLLFLKLWGEVMLKIKQKKLKVLCSGLSKLNKSVMKSKKSLARFLLSLALLQDFFV